MIELLVVVGEDAENAGSGDLEVLVVVKLDCYLAADAGLHPAGRARAAAAAVTLGVAPADDGAAVWWR